MFRIIQSLSVKSLKCIQPTRTLTVSQNLLKKVQFSDIDPESNVILLNSKGDNSQTVMKFSEVLEKVGKRQLVKVTKSKKKSDLPMFQLMSETDLEVATKKEKSKSPMYHGSQLIFETEDGRIKQKRLDMKSKITDNDFQYQVAKIVKWLEKGQFVVLTIKAARGADREDSEALKRKIEKVVAENKDIIPNDSRLTIKFS